MPIGGIGRESIPEVAEKYIWNTVQNDNDMKPRHRVGVGHPWPVGVH